MKKITFLFFFVLSINILHASVVPIATAKKVALNFYTQKFKEINPQINAKDIYIKDTYTVSDNAVAVYYIFNISDYG